MCMNTLDIVKKREGSSTQIQKYFRYAVPDVVSGLPNIHSPLFFTKTILNLIGVVKSSTSLALLLLK